MKGGITTEFTVWCAECESWYQTGSISTKARAIEEFKHMGWKLTKERKRNGFVPYACRRINSLTQNAQLMKGENYDSQSANKKIHLVKLENGEPILDGLGGLRSQVYGFK